MNASTDPDKTLEGNKPRAREPHKKPLLDGEIADYFRRENAKPGPRPGITVEAPEPWPTSRLQHNPDGLDWHYA